MFLDAFGLAIRRTAVVLPVALTVLQAGSARATSISATDLELATFALANFNEIVAGNLTTGSDTQGRAVVGGNASGASTAFCSNNCTGDVTNAATGATYGALTDYGNVSSSFAAQQGDIRVGGNLTAATVNLSHNGNVYVAGNNSAQVNNGNLYVTGTNTGSVQNGTAYTKVAATTTFPYASFQSQFSTPLNTLSAALASLTPNYTITSLPSGTNNYSFSGTGTKIGNEMVTVYSIAASALANITSIASLNVPAGGVVIINVLGTGSSITLPILNNYGASAAADVIWNFVDVTGITVSQTWYGSLLAPEATVTNSSNITGSVYASAVNQSAELHDDFAFTGDLSFLDSVVAVAEPASWIVLAAGLSALLLLRRRGLPARAKARQSA